MKTYPARITANSPTALALVLGLVVMISGCASTSLDVSESADSTSGPVSTQQAKPAAATKDKTSKPSSSSTSETGTLSELSESLVYDILVANIAEQRGEDEIALDSLTRAARTSKDRRLIAHAIQLATRSKEFETALSLSELLAEIDPKNNRVFLALINAQLELGKFDTALSSLVGKIRTTPNIRERTLQLFAYLLASHQTSGIAEDFYDQASEHADNAQLLLTAALLALRESNPELFLEFIDKAMKVRPDWETVAILKLSFFADEDNEQQDQVDEYANDVLTTYPLHHRFRLQYARFLIQQSSLETALDQFLLVLEHIPDSSEALYSSGLIYMDLEELDNAKEKLEHFLKLNPQHDQTRIYLAQIAMEQEQHAEAATYLRQVTSSQHYLNAQILLARALVEYKGIDAGIDHLQSIGARSVENKTRIILEQDALLRENNYLDRSMKVLDDGLERFPDHPDLLYSRGLLAAQLEKIDILEADMRALIRIQPDNAHAYNALGYTLADKTDRLEEAEELVAKANELLPNDAFILDSMGWIFFRKGEYEKALQFLRQAIELREDAEIAAHLGEVLWVTGDKESAREIWNRGQEWDAENQVLQETMDRFLNQDQAYLNHSPLIYPSTNAQRLPQHKSPSVRFTYLPATVAAFPTRNLFLT